MKKTLRGFANVLYQHDLELIKQIGDYLYLPDDIVLDLKHSILDEPNDSNRSKRQSVPDSERCNALIGNGTQCTRKHLRAQGKGDESFCLIHNEKRVGSVQTSLPISNVEKTRPSVANKILDSVIRDTINEQSSHDEEVLEQLSVSRKMYNDTTYLVSNNPIKGKTLVFEDCEDDPNIIGEMIDGSIVLY